MIRYVIYAIDLAFYLDITRTHILVFALSFLLPKARAPTLTLLRRDASQQLRPKAARGRHPAGKYNGRLLLLSIYYITDKDDNGLE